MIALNLIVPLVSSHFASFDAEILTQAERMRGRQDKQTDPTEVGKTETIRVLSNIFVAFDD